MSAAARRSGASLPEIAPAIRSVSGSKVLSGSAAAAAGCGLDMSSASCVNTSLAAVPFKIAATSARLAAIFKTVFQASGRSGLSARPVSVASNASACSVPSAHLVLQPPFLL